jgi:hypothetical protein
MGALAEKLHHPAPSWVGQRLKHIHYGLIVNDPVINVKAHNKARSDVRDAYLGGPGWFGPAVTAESRIYPRK